MRATRLVLGLALSMALLVGCGDAADDSAKAGASGEGESPGLIAGLLDSATTMLPSSGAEAEAEDEAAVERNQPGSKDPIVRCSVKGEVTFTRQSNCDNRGGQGERMALKVKNAR